ncbi:MAG: hypothetical protein ABSH16_13085 [Sedimentisphaerales bacterium]
MTFNELQKTWQQNEAGSKLTIDSGLLIREVKRNKNAFESTIFWRDFREVGVSIVMVGVFLHGAFKSRENIWVAGSFAVLAITCLFVAAFFLFWWYLLPLGAGTFLFGVVAAWNAFRILHSGLVLLTFGVVLLVVGFMFWGVYWLNQYAVRKGLAPRQQELESLLKTLAGNGAVT